MYLRGQMLAEGENYHVYNRGAHKHDIFTSDEDRERFLLLLYLYNTRDHVVMRDVLSKYSAKRFKGRGFAEIFKHEYSEKSLVDILAYTLMPNHFHLVLRSKTDNGIQQFLQKICGAYSMYFNARYDHSGTLFQGRYQSKRIDTESYFRYLFAYVHLNPLDLLQSDWKDKGIRCARKARLFLSEYRFSSFKDHIDERPERAILADELPDFFDAQDDLDELIKSETHRVHEKHAEYTKLRAL